MDFPRRLPTTNLTQTLHGQDFLMMCLPNNKNVYYDKPTFPTKQRKLDIYILKKDRNHPIHFITTYSVDLEGGVLLSELLEDYVVRVTSHNGSVGLHWERLTTVKYNRVKITQGITTQQN